MIRNEYTLDLCNVFHTGQVREEYQGKFGISYVAVHNYAFSYIAK